MAAGRFFSCSAIFLIFLVSLSAIPPSTHTDSSVKFQHVAWSYRLAWKARTRVVRHFSHGRVLYYSNAIPSFNPSEWQIVRSNDVETNPGFLRRSLSVFYQNSRSLKATIKDPEGKEVVVFKLGILKDIVYSADYNIVAITETWLNSKEINKIWKGKTPYIWTGPFYI